RRPRLLPRRRRPRRPRRRLPLRSSPTVSARSLTTSPTSPSSAKPSAPSRGNRSSKQHDMTVHGGERLAEVIYLPGATPPPRVDVEPDPAPAAPERGPAASTRAENIALHALTRRGQSRSELEDLLRRRDLDESTVQAELA